VAHRNPFPAALVGTYGTFDAEFDQLATRNAASERVAQTDSAAPDPQYISTNLYKRYGRYRRCRKGFCRKSFCVDTSSEKVPEVSTHLH
jgi:hypothetical protein